MFAGSEGNRNSYQKLQEDVSKVQVRKRSRVWVCAAPAGRRSLPGRPGLRGGGQLAAPKGRRWAAVKCLTPERLIPWQNNQTSGHDFLLSDLFQGPSAPWTFFALMVLDLLGALLGSTTMITLIRVDPHPHSPMYFLLGQLSLVDLLCISTFVPQMAGTFSLGTIASHSWGVAFRCSSSQALWGPSACCWPSWLMTTMWPSATHCTTPILMCPRVCTLLVLMSWLGALLNASIHIIYTMNLPYCASRQIHHFFCEIPHLLKLVCADTSQYEKGIFVSGVIFLLPLIPAILASYGHILFTVLGMRSSLGLRKTLATCSSHLTVVSLFYGALIFKYFLPKSYHPPERDEVHSIFYTILTTTLNPLIYSLRNKDIARALRRLLRK
ncbi:olfactory receptor 2Z1-like [Manis pentadactyla]|uniref:olfactory receptor 2Z1-like n=1 Tax=Manis pentadactyla TaxID=143292 RepID=UPI00255CB2FD|nr:olfactory receptor 2Z1-like [Manis pentadactyla]